MGEVEDELARLRRVTRARSRSESSTQRRAEAASSKTLTSSIAQMTIGTVPPATTTSISRSATTTLTTSSAVAATGQPSTQAGLADATLSATQSAAQLATGSPYAPASTRFPVPPGRMSTLLGDVPLPVPPVSAVDDSSVLRRSSCSGEHHPISLRDRTVLLFYTRRACFRRARDEAGTSTITWRGPGMAGGHVR